MLHVNCFGISTSETACFPARDPPAHRVSSRTDGFVEFFVSFLMRYLMIAIGGFSLLVGIQLPNLADQYTKRIDAHLKEVVINMRPFQIVADQYANGSLDSLIAMYRRSTEPAFKASANAIGQMAQRKKRFEAEAAAMQKNLPLRVLHMLLGGDKEILDETLEQYSYNVPLNQEAIVFGALLALAVLLLLEGLLALYRALAHSAVRFVNHRLL